MEVKSCGFLIVRGWPVREFLLMRHADRWDLPKGHVDAGETEIQCALRELSEETGLTERHIERIDGFRFATRYQVRSKGSGQLYDKTLIVFLARLISEEQIRPTEHSGFQWFSWNPPHRIQEFTIDPLLADLARFLEDAKL
jgi:bis(5'-nucleosidyl)-tetraphosphatase